MIMNSNKNQAVKKDNQATKPGYVNPLGSNILRKRINLNDINKRNAEEKRLDRKSSYTATGIMVLLMFDTSPILEFACSYLHKMGLGFMFEEALEVR